MRLGIKCPSPAMTVALIALYFAIHGGAIAHRSVARVASKPIVKLKSWVVISPGHVLAPGATVAYDARCPSGALPVGGGYIGTIAGVYAVSFHANQNLDGWHLVLHNASPTNHAEITDEVVCLEFIPQK